MFRRPVVTMALTGGGTSYRATCDPSALGQSAEGEVNKWQVLKVAPDTVIREAQEQSGYRY